MRHLIPGVPFTDTRATCDSMSAWCRVTRRDPSVSSMPVIIRLAEVRDAESIATLSRKTIERDMPWHWTPPAVAAAIRDTSANVVVAEFSRATIGFGIMEYGSDEAHLVLLAVDEPDRRKGLGGQLLCWLEEAAVAAGISRIRLEARVENAAALAFYRKHGYAEYQEVLGMYHGAFDGVRLAKVLGNPAPCIRGGPSAV